MVELTENLVCRCWTQTAGTATEDSNCSLQSQLRFPWCLQIQKKIANACEKLKAVQQASFGVASVEEGVRLLN